ncbi:protein tyrosine phosphatase domain-containing protein 1-like [Zootermopsis nevadensis]|uniref:Protein tyrosine phosphatase domain-containing protein 1 n=1 Tax=Zootermopsis nevadensis TaxID=136037 RepID=A0A067R4R8_ZOONE|nr:protein tyrosine phosphatase domain-containing protein 1-like [Zootermopsis nevadensis]XP_021922514.1 protein tyrosine phosphatase domain-containing protein 1-like [Zootermopsis nevadensis]XP_021922516.1 protein tyrosine phosphatase domain-containing protein 1-like [Zootermopsis nevadensis]KDR18115.1 Protein tyrosine phosphatase domain-containing protein 1 [Zootermopsis nevadensis]
MSQDVDVGSLVPAGLRSAGSKLQDHQVPANYSILSENLRRVTPNGIQCSIFCRGRHCKYENPESFDSTHMAIDGIFSHWVTDDILAMARPSTEIIKTRNIIGQFKSLGIKSIINLQTPGEHASCGNALESSGFTYDPDVFMENNIYFYNFGWKDYGEASLTSLLDMVKVMAFALTEGKVAVHCHAGLGRTGVLIACYLVYSLRVRANDAIRFVRLKRPNAVQTRGQILCVQEFEQFILPQSIVFCNREFVKDKKQADFSLTQYLNRQKLMLHGYEARKLKFIPKILFVLCERLLNLCDREALGTPYGVQNDVTSLSFTQNFIVARTNNEQRTGFVHSNSSSTVASASSTWRHCTELDDQLPSSIRNQDMDDDDDDDDVVAVPQNVPCISPDMPSCASGMSGLDDSCLDAVLGDGIHDQTLQDNICYQELSSQSDLRNSVENEKFVPYHVDDVAQALLADHNVLSDGTRKYIKQYRVNLNHRQSAWTRLQMEKNLYVLTGLLFDWLEHLRLPVLSRDDLSYIVILGSQPESCLKKINLASQYVLEYLFRFLAQLHPLSQETRLNLMKRFVASLTHQGVPIQGILKPSGKGYHKLREGTYQKVMEFVSKLFDMICETTGSTAPVFSELSKSQQSINSKTANDIEETEILTPL